MKRIDRYIFKEHLSPFFLSLLVLLFILLSNFFLKSIDKFLAKNIGIDILFEFLFYNMAWILALAVPMAVLIATLSAFGRLSADNEITAMKASGISTLTLLRTPLIFASILTILMIYFNNQILPDMNHNARSLHVNISHKKPELEFREGEFSEAIPNYHIYASSIKEINNINHFYGIKIFNNKNHNQKTITAKHGTIEPIDNGLLLHLDNGEIHEMMRKNSDYTLIKYDKYDVVVPIDNLALQKKKLKTRGDREMTYSMIVDKISLLDKKSDNIASNINKRIQKQKHLEISDLSSKENVIEKINQYETQIISSMIYVDLVLNDNFNSIGDSNLDSSVDILDVLQNINTNSNEIKRFKRKIKDLKRGINNDYRLIDNYRSTNNRYLVELHKKFSIPFASIVFVLVGAPLGIMARRGNFALSTTISLGFFIVYWIFLIAGESFADRGIISPLMSMWLPNIILGILGIYLIYQNSRDRKKLNFEVFNFLFKNKKKNDTKFSK